MTRQDVIRRIVERESHKQGLSEYTVRRQAAELYAAACEQFGTWNTALSYAGVNLPQVGRKGKFTPAWVQRRIRVISHSHYKITAKHIRRRDPALYRAAVRHFGSWPEALRSVGIDPEHAEPCTLSREQIIEALVVRSREGKSLRCCDVRRENYAFALRVKNVFGSWGRAWRAAGVEG